MKRKCTIHTKETLEPVVKGSLTYAECLRKLGVRPTGGNYKNLQRNIHKFSLDTSHMVHIANNQGYEFVEFDTLTKPSAIKIRLVKENGHMCTACNLTTWMGYPIPLELEHIDGNNRNNARSNVTTLCSNCHAQTPTWRNRKRR